MDGKYREHELDKHKTIWITKESYSLLRREKRKQKKSMMRIIDDLIKEKFNN